MPINFKTVSYIGFVIWILFLLSTWPFSLQHIEWVHVLLCLAPLMVVPIGMNLVWSWQKKFVASAVFLGACLFTLSFALPIGILAGLLATSWLLLGIYLFLKKFWEDQFHISYPLISLLFLVVGAAWSVADRFGYQPLDFDAVIVVLTGAHFHYAGFVLPLLVQQLKKRQSRWWYDWIGTLVVGGVAAVAIGITSTHFNGPAILEALAASIMILGGMGLALAHWAVLDSSQSILIKLLFVVGSLFLFAGMLLAFLYAWRFYFTLSFLSIPWMYAVHGSLNSIGTGLLLLLGWNQLKTVSSGTTSANSSASASQASR